MRRLALSSRRFAFAAAGLLVTGGAVFALLTVVGVGGHGPAAPPVPGPPAPQHMTRQQRLIYINALRDAGNPLPSGQRLSPEAPIAPSRFVGPMATFRRYAAGQLGRLEGDVAALRAALAGGGDRAAAREAWRTAFARYLGLGAVYGAFGDFDAKIDGLPGGLPGGVDDPHFTGLHRIEEGLWGDESLRSLVPYADRLGRDVRALRADLPHQKVEILDFSLRTHEILEDAQRDFLSGVDVPYSHEGVLATAAGVHATYVMLSALHSILGGADALGPARNGLARMRDTLEALRRAHGGRLPADDELTMLERERLNGSMDFALTQLSGVAGALETFDLPLIPKIGDKRAEAAR